MLNISREKKFYLTKQGLRKIKKEYQQLRALKIRETNNQIDANMPENFISLEARISELEEILKHAELIKIPPKSKRNVVNLGAKVLIEINGKVKEFEIVGSLESDPDAGKISNESPLGKALLGHCPGEKVQISSPIQAIYKIKQIRYS